MDIKKLAFIASGFFIILLFFGPDPVQDFITDVVSKNFFAIIGYPFLGIILFGASYFIYSLFICAVRK